MAVQEHPVSNGNHTQSDIPPFPDDVPTAPLICLSLKKLQEWDPLESKSFFRSCKELGFFYLNLEDCEEGRTLLQQADQLFGFGERLFDDDLTDYDFSDQYSYFGYYRVAPCSYETGHMPLNIELTDASYKGFGTSVIDKDGTRDRNEFYNVSKDDILGLLSSLPAPESVTACRPLLASYIRSSHAIITLLLKHLNKHLSLPESTLESYHQLDKRSGDQVRFVKAPPQPQNDRRTALGAHTDFGTLTILFNRLGGLQVLPPEEDEWLYVQPIPGHAIVNLGDALTKFSHRLLRSNIHRVVAPPGKQAELTRYSLVYFSRPQDDVLLKTLESSVIPPLMDGEVEEEVDSKTWVLRRAFGNRVGGKMKNVEGGEKVRL